MAQRVVDQHQRQHGLGNRRGADADARIVATVGFHVDRMAGLVDRAARLGNAGGRLDGDADLDVLAGRDAAENAAGVVAGKTVRCQLVTMHAAALGNRIEAGADLHALDGIDAHHGMGDIGVEAVKDRRAPADRHVLRHHPQSCAHRIQ